MKRRWRWLIALGVLAVLAVVLVAGFYFTVEYILGSDIPRQRVLATLRDRTGLRFDAERLTATWGGDTLLKNVTIGLPLEEEPFAVIPMMRVKHSSVMSMLAGGGAVEIESITIDGAEATVRQRADGSWDIVDVLQLIRREEGGEPAELPNLVITGTRLHVVSAGGKTITFDPVTATGEPTGGAGYRIEAELPPHLTVAGSFLTRGDYRHSITVEGERIGRMIQPWLTREDIPQPIRFAATWDGRLVDENLSGRLDVQHALAGPYSAAGVVGVTMRGEAVALEPHDLRLADSESKRQGRLVRGGVTISNERAEATNLLVEAMGITAQLDGHWLIAAQTGAVKGSWSGETPQIEATHTGQFNATLTRPAPNRRHLTAEVTTAGATPWGDWEAALNGSARGPSTEQLTWRLDVPTLRWRQPDGRRLVLDKLSAHGEVAGREVRLQTADLPSPDRGSIHAAGTYDLDARDWNLTVNGAQWRPPGDYGDKVPPLDVTVRAHGTSEMIEVEQLWAVAADGRLEGKATYNLAAETQPLAAELKLVWPLRQLDEEHEAELVADLPATDAEAAAPAPAPAQQLPLFRALFAWSGKVTGSLTPLDLSASGDLQARRLVANHQPLDTLHVPLELSIAGADVAGRTGRFNVLDGSAVVEGRYKFGGESGEVTVHAEQVAVDALAAIARPDEAIDLAGQLDADVNVRVQPDAAESIAVTGSWQVRDFAAPPLAFKHGSGRLRTTGRWLRLDEMKLTQNGGEATGTAWYDLQQGRDLRAQLTLTDWPIALEQYHAAFAVNADAEITGDLKSRAFSGSVEATSKVSINGEPAGNLNVTAALLGDSLRISVFETDVLGGSLKGEAHLLLSDQWPASTGRFTWEDLQLDRLRTWIEQAADIAGRVNGSFAFGPATDARAHEPLRFTATFEPQQLQVRGLLLDAGYVTGYAGPKRVIVDDSSLRIADGEAKLWASATRHGPDWFAQMQVDFTALNLDVLNRSFVEEGEEMPGLVSGRFSANGRAGDPGTLGGQGTVRIEQSDLIRSDIIGSVFRSVGIQGRQKDPTGAGSTHFRFESGDLVLDDFVYFNRGLEVHLGGRIEDVWLAKEAPINLYAVGTLRPLKDVKLPGASDLDRLLQGFQSTLTSLHATGTVGEPVIEQVNISEIGQSMMRALFKGGGER